LRSVRLPAKGKSRCSSSIRRIIPFRKIGVAILWS
jgi:hypothetical protein